MGMEVATPSKRLHSHALPLAMLVLALTMLSAASVYYYQHANVSPELNLGRALITQVMHVRPGANGWAQVSLQPRDTSSVAGGLGSSSSAGQAAEFTFSLQSK